MVVSVSMRLLHAIFGKDHAIEVVEEAEWTVLSSKGRLGLRAGRDNWRTVGSGALGQSVVVGMQRRRATWVAGLSTRSSVLHRRRTQMEVTWRARVRRQWAKALAVTWADGQDAPEAFVTRAVGKMVFSDGRDSRKDIAKVEDEWYGQCDQRGGALLAV